MCHEHQAQVEPRDTLRPRESRTPASCPRDRLACSWAPWPAATKPPAEAAPVPVRVKVLRRRRSSSPAASAARSSRSRPRTWRSSCPAPCRASTGRPGWTGTCRSATCWPRARSSPSSTKAISAAPRPARRRRVAQLEARVATAKDNLEIATRNLERFDNAVGVRLRGRARRRGREARHRGRRAGSRRSTRWRTRGCSSTRRTTTTSTASSSCRSTTRPSPRSTSSPASARPPTRSRSG